MYLLASDWTLRDMPRAAARRASPETTPRLNDPLPFPKHQLGDFEACIQKGLCQYEAVELPGSIPNKSPWTSAYGRPRIGVDRTKDRPQA